MHGNVSLLWSHLTCIPFCIDPELRFPQPFFFGGWYWEKWTQRGWSIRSFRLWSCWEFSEYQASTLAGGWHLVVFLPSFLVAAKQGRAVTSYCPSWRRRARRVAVGRLCQQCSDEAGLRSSQDARSRRVQISRDAARHRHSCSAAPTKVSAAWPQATPLGSAGWSTGSEVSWGGTVLRAPS